MGFFQEKDEYSPISIEDPNSDDIESRSASSPSSLQCPNKDRNSIRQRRFPIICIHLLLGIVWIVLFALIPTIKSNKVLSAENNSPLYSVVSFQPLKFSSGFAPDLSIYQGHPDEKNNAAWNELTHLGMVALTESEQSKLPETSAIFMNNTENSNNGDLYLGAVEVFHQLHCLDMLRMEIYGELEGWYKKHSPHNSETRAGHIGHCIDYIRQSMMCHPSLDILPFWTDPKTDQWRPKFDGTRMCANFDNIKDWAKKRKAGNLTPQ